MSTAQQTPNPEQPRPATSKSHRVLSCVLCQQRKVRCDREFPCANCTRADAECVPANALPRRQRRRRFPERELLERVRYYEGLLRDNKINFSPLHPYAEAEKPSLSEHDKESLEDVRSQSSSVKPSTTCGPVVDLWQAISQVTLDSDDEEEGYDDDYSSAALPHNYILLRHGEAVTKGTSIQRFRFQPEGYDLINDCLLFAPIYLDNVNPLLKVTHTPTLQPRIIDAVSNMSAIDSSLEALMFSIYCISIMTIDDDECFNLFRSRKKHLLASYQSACQQALLKCSLWRSCDINGLTAFYLYLVSVAPQTDARCLACLFSAAIRIAQRIGIHLESSNSQCTILEAEMRRRLWWAIVGSDSRICEMTEYKTTSLVPTWDCSVPLNVNDFELRPDMKKAPENHTKPTENLFAVVRSELADLVRHSTFHLNLVNPALTALAKPQGHQTSSTNGGSELEALEGIIETKHLSSCNVEDQLHFVTIWFTRGTIARSRLLDHYSQHSSSSTPETEEQRKTAIASALKALESDTQLRTSPLTKGYLWLVNSYLPALAYLYILNDLRKRPASDHAEEAWRAISNNYEALTVNPTQEKLSAQGVYVQKFSQLILQAWEARQAPLEQQGKSPVPLPKIVADVQNKSTPPRSSGYNDEGMSNNNIATLNNTSSSFVPSVPGNSAGSFLGGVQGITDLGLAQHYPDIPGQAVMDVGLDEFWTEVDWRGINAEDW